MLAIVGVALWAMGVAALLTSVHDLCCPAVEIQLSPCAAAIHDIGDGAAFMP